MLELASFGNISHPDFHVAVPHGAGKQSFLYYLNTVGLASSHWGWSPIKPKAPLFPNRKAKAVYARGVTISNLLPEPVKFASSDIKTFLVIRDPVGILYHIINEIICEGLNLVKGRADCRGYGTNISHIMGRFNKSDYSRPCRFTSLVGNVETNGDIFVIDAEHDIMPKKCFTTISTLAGLFGAPVDEKIRPIINTSYNAFANRVFRYFLPFTISLGGQSFPILVCPEHLFDFHYNHWKKAHVLDRIIVEHVKFAIFTHDASVLKLKDPVSKAFPRFSDEALDAIRFNITNYLRYCKLICELRDEYLVTREDILDYFKSNPEERSLFLEHTEKEIEIIKKLAPEKLEQWKYYKELVAM